jgi:hypothetical protein
LSAGSSSRDNVGPSGPSSTGRIRASPARSTSVASVRSSTVSWANPWRTRSWRPAASCSRVVRDPVARSRR